ncbi:nucleoside/nucleotide kinase family protein, partial [Mycolicibacterium elephantis]
FDGYGYLSLLQRIRAQPSHTVYAPAFHRDLEQPIAGSIPVAPDARLVVTEGNYLLDDDEPWPAVRAVLDDVWFLDVDRGERRRRLAKRHTQFGKTT